MIKIKILVKILVKILAENSLVKVKSQDEDSLVKVKNQDVVKEENKNYDNYSTTCIVKIPSLKNMSKKSLPLQIKWLKTIL